MWNQFQFQVLHCSTYCSVGSCASTVRSQRMSILFYPALLQKLLYIYHLHLFSEPLFLQDYTITTCTGVFISLKLVQYLSRRRQLNLQLLWHFWLFSWSFRLNIQLTHKCTSNHSIAIFVLQCSSWLTNSASRGSVTAAVFLVWYVVMWMICGI